MLAALDSWGKKSRSSDAFPFPCRFCNASEAGFSALSMEYSAESALVHVAGGVALKQQQHLKRTLGSTHPHIHHLRHQRKQFWVNDGHMHNAFDRKLYCTVQLERTLH